MPPIHTVSHRKGQPLTARASSSNHVFTFPPTYHLVITTPERVLSYDTTGLHDIFASGSNGILAAKEARDGSGTLAVADSQVVLLHRVAGGLQKSYRLKGTDGQIRLLQFSPDSSSLLFTTTLLDAVQSYSLPGAELLDPGPTHNSAVTVLAVSPTSHVLLTASESPPTVYLQPLGSEGRPIFLQPQASKTPVVLASFHPERPDIFLLAFKDGSVAFYDATQIVRTGPTAAKMVEGCEIVFFKNLHRVVSYGIDELAEETSTGARSSGVTGASFLPGYRDKAVCVGADGKCNIVDFEKNKVDQTWSTKGSATAVSLLALDAGNTATKKSTTRLVRSNSAAVPRLLLAIGTSDGRVLFFDSCGILLLEQTVNESSKRVIDVEWIKGPAPQSLPGKSTTLHFSNETCIELFTHNGTLRSRKSHPHGEPSSQSLGNIENPSPIGKRCEPSSVYPEDASAFGADTFDTVKHHDLSGPIHRDLPVVMANDYMDLFSPVKQVSRNAPALLRPSPKRRTTPRPRPRLSSSTFVDQASRADYSPNTAQEQERQDPMTSGALPSGKKSRVIPFALEKKLTLSPMNFKAARRSQQTSNSANMSNIRIPGSFRNSVISLDETASSNSSTNSKILADIRRFGETGTWSSNPKGGNTAILAPYMPHRPVKPSNRRKSSKLQLKPSSRRVSAHRNSPKKGIVLGTSDRGDLDAELDTDDIWLTAESESEAPVRKPRVSLMTRRRQEPTKEPRRPIRQGSPTWNCVEQETRRMREDSPSQAQHNTLRVVLPKQKAVGDPMPKRRDSILLNLTPILANPNANLSRTKTVITPSNLFPHTMTPSVSLSPSLHRSSPTKTSSGYNSSNASPKHLRRTPIPYSPSPKSKKHFKSAGTAPELPLPPGFAQSYQGPVDVGNYLPRKGSLAFVGSPLVGSRERKVLGDTSGNGRRGSVRRKGKGVIDEDGRGQGHHHRKDEECTGCGDLKSEVERLKEEVEQLRRLLLAREQAE